MRSHKSKAERIYEILNQLSAGRTVQVSELSRLLGVSQVQIRSDLAWLERIVPLERHHGGASFEAPYRGTVYAKKRAEDPSEKRMLAAYVVAEHIKHQDQLFLDSGTT